VLVPVFRDAVDELRLVMVVRGEWGIHGGQLALPGGKPEPEDASLLDTALREAEEEVGLQRSRVEVLTALEPIDARTTGIRVYPYLARVRPPERWRLASGEICAVVTPSVRALADPSTRHERLLSFPGWPEARRVPCIELEEGHLLWGLTLRMLEPLLPRLLAGEFGV
jgi:8-oxo-dGTP pyrophosphatase MutT (NUDIX family)